LHLSFSGSTMVNKAMTPAERIDHWNRRAEETRLKALCTEICQHLKTHHDHLAPVASKLRSLGVIFVSDQPSKAAGSADASQARADSAISIFLVAGQPLEQQKFPILKQILTQLDNRFCSDVHLKMCKEGKARDINKEGVLKIIELVTKLRRTFVVEASLASESAFMEFICEKYVEQGCLLQKIRLPVKYAIDGSFYVAQDRASSLQQLHSLEFGVALPLQDIVGEGVDSSKITFEENWTANAIMVLPDRSRLECRKFFLERTPRALLAPRVSLPPASSSGLAGALQDEPAPAPKRRRRQPLALEDGIAPEATEETPAEAEQSFADERSEAPPPPPPASTNTAASVPPSIGSAGTADPAAVPPEPASGTDEKEDDGFPSEAEEVKDALQEDSPNIG